MTDYDGLTSELRSFYACTTTATPARTTLSLQPYCAAATRIAAVTTIKKIMERPHGAPILRLCHVVNTTNNTAVISDVLHLPSRHQTVIMRPSFRRKKKGDLNGVLCRNSNCPLAGRFGDLVIALDVLYLNSS